MTSSVCCLGWSAATLEVINLLMTESIRPFNPCLLHTRVEGHRQKASSICKYYYKEHNTAVPNNFLARFIVIKKCMNKFDCLVNEMLCIQELKPTLNVQSDSLRAKVFK